MRNKGSRTPRSSTMRKSKAREVLRWRRITPPPHTSTCPHVHMPSSSSREDGCVGAGAIHLSEEKFSHTHTHTHTHTLLKHAAEPCAQPRGTRATWVCSASTGTWQKGATALCKVFSLRRGLKLFRVSHLMTKCHKRARPIVVNIHIGYYAYLLCFPIRIMPFKRHVFLFFIPSSLQNILCI